jgi:nucleoporin POM152
LEQEVWGLPTAHFSHFAKHGFCVQDELISKSSDDLVLELSGQSPFTIELQVKEQGKKGTKEFKIPDIKNKHWAISLPFKLNNPNFYSIAVRRIVDSHGCETLYDSAPPPPPTTTNDVDLVNNKKIQNKANFAYLTVSETATISPVTSQIDHCVGDFLDFNIQGSPPFTVKYEFKGKQHSVPLKSGSKFSRLATEEGTFKILSVGRGQDQQCRTNKIDLYVKNSNYY